jgi:membrane fusion protein (multidrug efflux system)
VATRRAGRAADAIVPLEQLWVDANFKEAQLREMRIGQPVRLTADLYGSKVEYRGKVAGLAAGTGGAFALLPPQNATGNCQDRAAVPVRIALDPAELAEHPLRVGLSMEVTVDTAERGGKTLADAPRAQAVAATGVYEALDREVDERIRRIVK